MKDEFMFIEVAPIIHARTALNDFPGGMLLLAPDTFSDDEVKSCRMKADNSTRDFDMARDNGRRFYFCTDKYIIFGASLRIQKLHELGGGAVEKYEFVEDPGASGKHVHGFIGLAIKRDNISKLKRFIFPYALLAKYYDVFMNEHWHDATNPNSAYRHPFELKEIKEELAQKVPEGDLISIDCRENGLLVFDENKYSADIIVSHLVTVRNNVNFSYCSDVYCVDMAMHGEFEAISSYSSSSFTSSSIVSYFKEHREVEKQKNQCTCSQKETNLKYQYVDEQQYTRNKKDCYSDNDFSYDCVRGRIKHDVYYDNMNFENNIRRVDIGDRSNDSISRILQCIKDVGGEIILKVGDKIRATIGNYVCEISKVCCVKKLQHDVDNDSIKESYLMDDYTREFDSVINKESYGQCSDFNNIDPLSCNNCHTMAGNNCEDSFGLNEKIERQDINGSRDRFKL